MPTEMQHMFLLLPTGIQYFTSLTSGVAYPSKAAEYITRCWVACEVRTMIEHVKSCLTWFKHVKLTCYNHLATETQRLWPHPLSVVAPNGWARTLSKCWARNLARTRSIELAADCPIAVPRNSWPHNVPGWIDGCGTTNG